jgi:hypothetical protein
MSKEHDITKRVTGVIKAGDKLVQDLEKDVGQIIMAVNGVKELLGDIKSKIQRTDDKEGV